MSERSLAVIITDTYLLDIIEKEIADAKLDPTCEDKSDGALLTQWVEWYAWEGLRRQREGSLPEPDDPEGMFA